MLHLPGWCSAHLIEAEFNSQLSICVRETDRRIFGLLQWNVLAHMPQRDKGQFAVSLKEVIGYTCERIYRKM